jgi:hypothetical protein
MIKEIMEYYFDKKIADTQGSLVTMDYFHAKCGQKLDASIFHNYAEAQAN